MKNFKCLIAWICCTLLAANLCGQTPLPLFSPADGMALTPDEMRFLDALEQEKTTASIQIVSANLAAFKTSGTVQVENLGGSGSLTLRSTKTEVRSERDFSWAAAVEGRPTFTANFVWNNGFVHGNLYLGKAIYAIMPLSRERQALVRLNTSAFPPEDCHFPDKKQGHARPTHEPENGVGEEDDDTKISPAANCRIRLIVGFTHDVDNENVDPRGAIQLAVDAFNEINENSGVFHRVELARVFEVNYSDSGNPATDLANWENEGDGIMDEVHVLRNLYDADLAGLIVMSNPSACGKASAVGAEYANAFQVTKYSCASGSAFTFAHEFAHLLDANHDPFVNSGDGTNKGRVNLSASWRTVMAYEDFCDCSDEVQPCPDEDDRVTPSEPNCPRIKHWSNPAVDYDGDPTGLWGVHENEDAIDNYDEVVANFEGYVTNKVHLINDVVADDEEANILGQLTASNANGVQLEFNNNSKGSIRAGEVVTLRPGFWAKQGSDFTALIGNCTNPFEPPAQARAVAEPVEAPAAVGFGLVLSPNPARSAVSIRCSIPSPGQVTVELVDLVGRRAALVQAEALAAGLVVHELDVAGLAPGVYFLKMKSGGNQAIERLVVAE